jgi:hypothetical protein
MFQTSIIKALELDYSLSINEFIKVIDFKINEMLFDTFWNTIVNNKDIFISKLVLDFLGYEGEYFKQKDHFLKYLSRNNFEYKTLNHDDAELNNFRDALEELESIIPNNRIKATFIIMNSRQFKKSIMCLKTKKGDDIREYYLCLEELIQLYMSYQKQYEIKKHKISLDTSCVESDGNATGIRLGGFPSLETEGFRRCRFPDTIPQEPQLHELFIIIKLDTCKYYVIRSQNKSVQKAINKQLDEYPKLEVKLTILTQPNSKSLYSRIKERLKDSGVRFSYNKIFLAGYDYHMDDAYIEDLTGKRVFNEKMLLDCIISVNNEKFIV